MSKGKLIKVCGECANYDWKKHRCKLGCNEGEPQEPFYRDCPLPTVDTDQICKQSEPISCDHENGGEWRLGKSGCMYFCSECNYAAHPREVDEWSYCPNCGAKMKGDKWK